MAKRKGPTKKFKSFSDLHGSKSDMFKKKVSPEQLGHDAQLPVNPATPMGSPLINPGQPGHPLGASMNSPSGEDFY